MLKKNYKRAMTFAAVIGLLVFLHAIGITRPAENAVVYALNPVFGKVYYLSSRLRAFYYTRAAQTDSLREIAELRGQVASLTEENAKLQLAEEENRLLRQHLLFLDKNDYHYVIANVISRGDLSGDLSKTETITIDKGGKDGVYAGLAVTNQNGIIVGKVVEADDDISKVYLANNSKCKLAATILDDNKTSGITEGELGLTVSMGFIPQDTAVEAGDIVVTSGLEESIPRGLVVGQVISVSRESNELWQTATIESAVSPDNLVIVAVLLP